MISIEIPLPEIKIVADPNNLPVNEKYYNSVRVVIEATNSEDQIYFSKDGSDPIGENRISYEKGKEIEIIGGKSSETVIARAYRPSIDKWSSPSELKISFDVSHPEFTPKGNTYNTDKTIQISSKSNKAKCYYTQDNSDPSEYSTYYSSGIEITGDGTNITIKSMCIWGDLKSNTVSEEYTIDYQSIDLWNGIVAYYPFNGNVKDESGVNNNDGVSYNLTSVSDRFGNIGRSYNFIGNSYISVNDSESLKSLNNEITISSWVKSLGNYYLLAKTSQLSYQYRVYNLCGALTTESKYIHLGYYTNTYQGINLYKDLCRNNEWVHIAITHDNYGTKFYLNGQLEGDNSTKFNFTSDDNPLEIGRDKHGATEYSNSTLDEIRIYNRSLSEKEISALYSFNDSPPTPGNNGIISTSNISTNSMTLTWTKASDSNSTGEYLTPQNKLQYKVFQSTSNNISSLDTIDSNGTVLKNWTTGLQSLDVTGLNSGTSYYFNVLVRDEHGNRGIYSTVSYSITDTIPPLVSNKSITITNVTSDSLVINWSQATDNSTPQNMLRYYVYTHINSTFTGSGGHNFGDPLYNTSFKLMNNYFSAEKSYYVKVIVKDLSNNTSEYNVTPFVIGIEDKNDGSIYSYSKNIYFLKCSQGQIFINGVCDGSPNYFYYCKTFSNECNSNINWLLNGQGDSSVYKTCSDLNSIIYLGKNNWRVPNYNELSYINVDLYNNANSLFSNQIYASTYWSSNAMSNGAYGLAIAVKIAGGSSSTDKRDNYYVRCVRDP
ncbi:MAG: DUF1566 domain-containing protein [Leptospiraceae bacterium]|nr:DUF1566 domain-containing protein [Leptospiraceae bacterium]